MIAAFLRLIRQGGSIVLTSIVPDGPATTNSFDDPDLAEAWARARNDNGEGVFTHVNPTTGPLIKKATKTDIAALEFLHVDLDPRVGEDLALEKTRLLGLLTTNRPKGIPAPTIIVDSGGGYHAWWRLDEPIPINGDVAKAEEAERWNRALEAAFGADACHDCSRLLRLPGTKNWPNKKKRDKGRTATDAFIVESSEGGKSYPLSAFASLKLPPLKVGVPITGGHPGITPQSPGRSSFGEPLSVGNDELLRWAAQAGVSLPDRPLALIATGDASEWGSDRSQMVFYVCAELLRAGVPELLIASAIHDTANPIHAHVHEKGGRNPWTYAQRQVQRAKESNAASGEPVAPELAEMNARHAVIVSGKVRVLSWSRTSPRIDRLAPDLQSFEDFRNRYRHQRVIEGIDQGGNPIYRRKGEWWLDHPQRREILGICFAPGEPAEVDGFQNLWRGWGVEPKRGDWSLMREHVRSILANGNEEHANYILRWAAWAVQNPEKQAEAALVFRGRQGTGKGFFGRTLKDLFGQHGLHIKSAKHLTGDFNLHLRDCCLLFADEAIAPGDKGAESRLKGLITEPDLTIEGKGENLVTEPNHLHVVMASNEDWVVPAQADERRFAVFDVSSTHQRDRAYFEAMAAQLEDGGKAAMLFDLLEMPLDEWHPRWAIPQTNALAKQKAEGLIGFEAFAFDLLVCDEWPVDQDIGGYRFVATQTLHESAQRWLRGRPGVNHVTANKIGEVMADLLGCRKHRISGGRNGYLLCDTSEMRRRWNAARFAWAWDTSVTTVSEPERAPF
jgi:hypothetical protein